MIFKKWTTEENNPYVTFFKFVPEKSLVMVPPLWLKVGVLRCTLVGTPRKQVLEGERGRENERWRKRVTLKIYRVHMIEGRGGEGSGWGGGGEGKRYREKEIARERDKPCSRNNLHHKEPDKPNVVR